MTVKVAYHKWHVVTGPAGGTVKSLDGTVTFCKIPENGQGGFYATTTEVVTSVDSIEIDEVTPNCAPALGFGSGGGVEIKFDANPTQNSTNAVTSGGLYNILYGPSVKLGRGNSLSSFSVTIGDYASAAMGAVAIGKSAIASGGNAVVLGAYSEATKDYTSVLGQQLKLKDEGCVLIGAWNKGRTQVVQLYLIAGGSPLATTYEDGAACLGYVVKDASGNIIDCGTRKLSELLTNHGVFAPAALDLDAPAPTPFLPTGIMEPIEFPEDLTEGE